MLLTKLNFKHMLFLKAQATEADFKLKKKDVAYNEGSNQIVHIRITCPCNEDPLTPQFYIVKLGFTGYSFFFLFCSETLIVGTR